MWWSQHVVIFQRRGWFLPLKADIVPCDLNEYWACSSGFGFVPLTAISNTTHHNKQHISVGVWVMNLPDPDKCWSDTPVNNTINSTKWTKQFLQSFLRIIRHSEILCMIWMHSGNLIPLGSCGLYCGSALSGSLLSVACGCAAQPSGWFPGS